MRAYKVYAIESGTVIDHIPDGKALEVINVLSLVKKNKGIVTAGIHLESKKHELKDVVKIENLELDKEEVNKIALLAPTATINIIKNHEVDKKYQVEIPKKMGGFVKCSNPKCITNNEEVKTKFSLVKKDPLQIRCNYCERTMSQDDIVIL